MNSPTDDSHFRRMEILSSIEVFIDAMESLDSLEKTGLASLPPDVFESIRAELNSYLSDPVTAFSAKQKVQTLSTEELSRLEQILNQLEAQAE